MNLLMEDGDGRAETALVRNAVALVSMCLKEQVDIDGDALLAKGSGVINFRGSGHLRGSICRGNLTVSGKFRVSIERYSKKEALPSGAIRYIGISGALAISGQDVIVTLEGDRISLKTWGSGSVQLRGEGVFNINEGTIKAWKNPYRDC